MKILFICKFNRFRSKFAEAFFNKFNKNKKNRAKSAGLIKGNPISKNTFDLAAQKGLKLIGKPRGINVDLLLWCDILIIVADDVPKAVFEDKRRQRKILIWNIRDTKSEQKDRLEKIVSSIELKVKKLISSLN